MNNKHEASLVMEVFENQLRADAVVIKRICSRAWDEESVRKTYRDKLDLVLDVSVAHYVNPMRLQDWLESNDFNFLHDILGIQRNLDREEGKMMNCFSPRFSA